MPSAPGTELTAAICCVGLVAYASIVIKSASWYWWFAFVTSMAAGILIVASPTPPGYAWRLSEHRWGGTFMAYYGPRLASICAALCGTSILCATGLRRTRHNEREDEASLDDLSVQQVEHLTIEDIHPEPHR